MPRQHHDLRPRLKYPRHDFVQHRERIAERRRKTGKDAMRHLGIGQSDHGAADAAAFDDREGRARHPGVLPVAAERGPPEAPHEVAEGVGRKLEVVVAGDPQFDTDAGQRLGHAGRVLRVLGDEGPRHRVAEVDEQRRPPRRMRPDRRRQRSSLPSLPRRTPDAA